MVLISIIVCTYNPQKSILDKVIESLKLQTIDNEFWELIVVDNNSNNDFIQWLDLKWKNNAHLVVESKAGLTYARLAGVKKAIGNMIIFVDDDNVLDKNYLQKAFEFSQKNIKVGCFGGKSIPLYESPPPSWLANYENSLGCQDLGEEMIISTFNKINFKLSDYPSFAPIGTGMVLRKEALKNYIQYIDNGNANITDRTGESLSSGGDNEIVIFIIKGGWEIAYTPELLITHLIPKKRVSYEYICRMSKDSNKSWVRLCIKHRIGNYKTISKNTVALRKIKSFIFLGALFSKKAYVKWKGACGIYEGLSDKN